MPSLARSVPKPLLIELREAGGHQSGGYEPLSIFAAALLIPWSSTLGRASARPEGSTPVKLIVDTRG